MPSANTARSLTCWRVLTAPGVPCRAPGPSRNVPAQTGGAPAQPPAASLRATSFPATPVPPAPGLPAETVPFFDNSGALFPSAMAGSPAVSAVSSSNASLFGQGPAVSAGLLSSRRLTSGPDYQMIGDQAPLTLRQAASPAPGLPPPFPPGMAPSPPSPRLASGLGVKQVLFSDVPFFARGVLSAIPIVLRTLTLLERKSPTLHTRPSVGYVKSALIIAVIHCNHALPAPIFMG